MANYTVNAFIKKKGETRRNFWVASESTDDAALRKLILTRLDDDKENWSLKQDSLRLIPHERVVIYECEFEKIEKAK